MMIPAFSLRGAQAMAVLLATATCAVLAADPPPATQPVVAAPRPILPPAQKLENARQVIDTFVTHVKSTPAIPAAAKGVIEQEWAKHRADEDPSEFLTAGIAIVSEPYKNALQAMEKEQYGQAESLLRTLAADKDAYLSLHASSLLARALVEQEKLEEAEALLIPLAAREKELMEKTFLEADVDFLLGYCQLSNLHYEQAQASLQSFDNQHPDAPERLRLPARQMLQELAARKPESLGEVSDLMVYASRRLGTGAVDKPVQLRQDRAIELLSKLIKQAEDQENQQNSNNDSNGGDGNSRGQQQSSDPQGNQSPNSPASESKRPAGKGKIGDLHRSGTARPGDEWGKMPPEERDKVMQSLRRNFPSQYRQLVEQYYKQLAKEK